MASELEPNRLLQLAQMAEGDREVLRLPLPRPALLALELLTQRLDMREILAGERLWAVEERLLQVACAAAHRQPQGQAEDTALVLERLVGRGDLRPLPRGVAFEHGRCIPPWRDIPARLLIERIERRQL